jgi:hypothetical protein
MARIKGATFKVDGINELESQFKRIGKMPKKHLNRSAKEGIKDPEKEAKARAPVGKTGTLRKSVKKMLETPNKRNKGVYRLRYDAKFTDHFQKKTTGVYGGKTPHAYYPASVEYGYKGKYGKVIPKTQYTFKKIMAKHEKSSAQKVVDSLNKSITELTKG